jgi:hypothetical protein
MASSIDHDPTDAPSVSPPADYSDLRALFVNCTLKRSPEVSNTQGLADLSVEIMRRQGTTVDVVRAMTWNLLHLARMLKDAGGVPAHGNQRSEWDAGCRFDFPNPEHR